MAMPPVPAIELRAPRRRDWRRVVVGSLLAFAIPLALVSLAGALVRDVGADDGSNALDARVLDWMVDRRSDGLTHVMRTVTALGGTLVLVALTVVGVVVLVLVRRAWLAGFLVTVVIGASLLSSIAKAIVGRRRPPVGLRLSAVGESAFPSGHSTQAAATYLAVAIIVGVVIRSPVLRSVVWGVCAAIVVGVGLSRLYLGVHWGTDVLAGWLFGTAWAVGAAWAFGLLRRRPGGPLEEGANGPPDWRLSPGSR
jgi:undecaprenyl-diphosphatase